MLIPSRVPEVLTRSYPTTVLDSNPRGYWQLQDASGNPVDSSGNGFNVTSGSATAYQQAGQTNLADFSIQYNSNISHIRTPQVSTVTDNFTLEGWFQPSAVTITNSTLFYNGAGGSNGWGILLDTSFKFKFLAGGVAVGGGSVAQVPTTSFSHIVVLRRAGTWEYYFNGALDTANAGANAPGAPSGTTFWGVNGIAWKGEHLAIYETALTAAQIRAHYLARLYPAGAIGPEVVDRPLGNRASTW